MEIAVIDDRHPFTVALAYGLETGRINPELEILIQKELQDLVSESTKKFVGFKNVESVYKGLDVTLGILSLAVVHSTKGEENLERWLDYILEKGLKGVAKDAIAMAKEISTSSERAVFGEEDLTFHPTLKAYLIHYSSRDQKHALAKTGYAKYLADVSARKNARTTESLVKFLITEFLKMSQRRWLDIVESEIGEHFGLFEPSLILNNILFRHCTKLPMRVDLSLSKAEFEKVRLTYETDKVNWVNTAQKRYDALKKKIPEELRPALFYGKDWFVWNLLDGPPKLPNNWPLDLSIEIPRITGVYWYQMME